MKLMEPKFTTLRRYLKQLRDLGNTDVQITASISEKERYYFLHINGEIPAMGPWSEIERFLKGVLNDRKI